MGVCVADELTEDVSGEGNPGILRRPWAARCAASDSEMAEAFFLVLKLNFGRGSTAARVSTSLSCRALMAWKSQYGKR